jgi:Na+-transporting NADH:ubiquinone oxidoreductase subunit F
MRDYSLAGPEAERAAARGLVDGEWFRPPIDPDRLRELTERANARAVVDFALWIALIIATGVAAVWSIGDWWSVPAFALYGAVTSGAADARWHEFGHGTAARSARLNDAAYWFASFLLWRSPTAWRWSHFRHHTDTIIVGRDPEIQVGRPARMTKFVLNYTNLVNGPTALWLLIRYAAGRLDADTLDFTPGDEQHRVVRESRIFLAVLVAVIVLSVVTTSWIPLLLVGLPTIYGAWLMVFFGATQHLGLGEDVLDHRYSTRTVYMNPIFRFLYLNMNYHVEHHMFPAVPYSRLPALHAEIKHTLPAPSPSMFHAYREIIAALWKQRDDPAYTPRDRIVPDVAPAQGRHGRLGAVRPDGSFDLGPLGLVEVGSISRVDVLDHTFAVARLDANSVCVVDGLCTHGRAHLADGALVESVGGPSIECPKHNGRFDLASGAPCRKPVTVAINIHDVAMTSGHIIITPPATVPATLPAAAPGGLRDRTVQEHPA